MADHSNLPAPYESPWRQLGQALQAVLASLRLDLRSLWRRNCVGELPRPRFWPRDLAPLFWPVVVVLLIAAGIGLSILIKEESGSRVVPPDQPQTSAPTATTTVQPVPEIEPAPVATTEVPITTETTEPAPAPAPASDPLRTALAQIDGLDLISATWIGADPTLLQLRLSERFSQLDPRRQQRLAETWLERSQELGFEQLELLTANGQVVGYRARVGSGMILLDPNAAS